MSFKLLRKAQKEELQQRREMRKSGNYQVHPQVAEEWKRLEKLKKDLEIHAEDKLILIYHRASFFQIDEFN